MKKKFVFVIALVLELLAFQYAYSEDIRIKKYIAPYNRRYVLWKVYTQPLDSNAEMYVTVDSALRENFYIRKNFYISQYKKKYTNVLNPNTYYIVLATAGCSVKPISVEECFLAFQDDDYILPDTPENRVFLNKKWEETKVIYIEPNGKPRLDGRDVDM